MKKILVAHDGSKFSAKALKMALQIATQFGSTLIVLSVVPELHLTELSALDQGRIREALEKQTRKNLEKARAALRSKDVTVKTIVQQGNAAEVILEQADKFHVGLIVTGSHGRQGAERFLLGSVSANVVEHSRRPVLVVK